MRTITINRENNTILTKLGREKLVLMLAEINARDIPFRDKLNLPDYVTFGTEIEVNGVDLSNASLIVELFNDVYEKNRTDASDVYAVHEEPTCIDGSEIVSYILKNNKFCWRQLKEMMEGLGMVGATVGDNTASHIHVGSHMINTPQELSLLLKTLVVFEPIIFKFGYGESNKPRESIRYEANRCNFALMQTPRKVKKMVSVIDTIDKYRYYDFENEFEDFNGAMCHFRPAFNFQQFNIEKLYGRKPGWIIDPTDNIEIRCANGTLNVALLQNFINLICHILVSVHEGKIDEVYVNHEYEKYIKKRYSFDYPFGMIDLESEGKRYNRLLDGFSKVQMDKALKLSDMIFSNDMDKLLFLKQYLKLFKAPFKDIVDAVDSRSNKVSL